MGKNTTKSNGTKKPPQHPPQCRKKNDGYKIYFLQMTHSKKKNLRSYAHRSLVLKPSDPSD